MYKLKIVHIYTYVCVYARACVYGKGNDSDSRHKLGVKTNLFALLSSALILLRFGEYLKWLEGNGLFSTNSRDYRCSYNARRANTGRRARKSYLSSKYGPIFERSAVGVINPG